MCLLSRVNHFQMEKLLEMLDQLSTDITMSMTVINLNEKRQKKESADMRFSCENQSFFSWRGIFGGRNAEKNAHL